MANGRAKVTQAEIARALKAAGDAGLVIAKFDVLQDGGLRIYLMGDLDERSVNEWDRGLGTK